MFIDTQKLSVGVNKFPENKNSLETDELYVRGKNVLDLIYPIGSVYTSTKNINPETLFGGEWEACNSKDFFAFKRTK